MPVFFPSQTLSPALDLTFQGNFGVVVLCSICFHEFPLSFSLFLLHVVA